MAQARAALMAAALPGVFVVDCSIVAAAFLADEQSPLAAQIRESCAELTLVAPRILRLEFLNVALAARQRGRLDDAQFASLLAQGAQFPVSYEDADGTLVEFGRNAFALGLASYDYAYLDCARRRRLPLATLDRTLIRACATVGVECLADARIAEPSATYRRGIAAARPKREAVRGAPRRSRST